MSALYAILGFLVIAFGAATGYRLLEKRSRKGEEDPTSVPAIERQIEPPPTQIEPAIAPPSAETKTINPVEIPDPWLSEAEETTSPEALPTSSEPTEAVMIEEPPLTEAQVREVVTTPIAPTDLSSPPALSYQPLVETITKQGRSRQLQKAASIVRYANHGDSAVRASVAIALGNLATNRAGTTVENFIPILNKLSQDPKSVVRVAAVESLGKIRSPKVLPILQRSQRQSDPSVRKAATVALQKLKLGYQTKPKTLKHIRQPGQK